MTEEREEQIEDDISEKKSFIRWVKENKSQLLLVGISISALATNISFQDNSDEKHKTDANLGGTDGKKYLYDIIDIKTKRSTPLKLLLYGKNHISLY